MGYCIDGETRMLLYEYIHEGSLYDHLHGTIFAHSSHINIGLLEDICGFLVNKYSRNKLMNVSFNMICVLY